MAFPDKQASAILASCREQGTPFILSVGGRVCVAAFPPDHTLIIFDPPMTLTPDVLRALLAGRLP